MNKFATLFEFGCELFGYANANNLSKEYISKYYNDWKYNYTKMSIKQYKSLKKVRT